MLELPHPKPPANELHETRLKRLAMRSMRRGIKEMDLILHAYATERLTVMSDADLALYDDLLNENDHDLYQWVTGQFAAKPQYTTMIGDIQEHIAGN